MADGIGLDLVQMLREMRPEVRIVVVTGDSNVDAAVAAIKAVSLDYLVQRCRHSIQRYVARRAAERPPTLNLLSASVH